MQLSQLRLGELVEGYGQECAVRMGDAWPVDLPLQDVQLVA